MKHSMLAGRCVTLSCQGLREILGALLRCCGDEPQLRITAHCNGDVRFVGASTNQDGDIQVDILDTAVPGTVTLSVDPANIKDAKGKQTTLDGKLTWSVQDGQDNVTLVSQADDGFSAVYHITDNIAATQAVASGDARQGPDVVPISGTFVFNVMTSDATTLGDITASAITPDP